MTAYCTSFAFGLTFLIATFAGVGGTTALRHSVASPWSLWSSTEWRMANDQRGANTSVAFRDTHRRGPSASGSSRAV
ncbi:MAG: hypothetical protein KF830_02345, partial [Planctomycetes bacterium]|nr:hypothetical protein [Planctomycetota bacterium]